jgi:penicillin amidase
LGLLAVVIVVAIAASVLLVSAVRDSLPTTSGEATLPGLAADVTVMRDGSGVPHIYGDSMTDLARAQGYVHAQERFFEMDVRRHSTAGRIAELVGAQGLDSDKVVRTMGWRRVAEEELPTLKPQTRQMLQAYADGVNTYLRGRSPGEVAVEYSILGLTLPTSEIEEWSPLDSLAWLKAMAWDLKGNYNDELARARLSGRLTLAQINQIYPGYDYEARPPILSAQEWSPAPGDRASSSASGSRRPVPPPRTPPCSRRSTRCPRCSAAARASARTPSPSPGRAPRRERRCSPTTRTSRSASPACGSRTACGAARSRRRARSTSAASRSRGCRAS